MTIRVTTAEAEDRLEELIDAAVAGNEVLLIAPDGMVFWLKPLVAPDGTPLPHTEALANPRQGTSHPRNR